MWNQSTELAHKPSLSQTLHPAFPTRCIMESIVACEHICTHTGVDTELSSA